MSDDLLFEPDEHDLEAREKARAARELELFTIRDIMAKPHGRKMFYRLIVKSRTYDNVYSVDPYAHAYNAGFRASGLNIIAELKEASLDLYYVMLRENES